MEEHQEEKNESLVSELGADLTKGKNGNIYTLTIIGQVEGHVKVAEMHIMLLVNMRFIQEKTLRNISSHL